MHIHRSRTTRGFTLVEVMVVMGILAALTGFTLVNLPAAQRRAYLDTATSTFVSDLKAQQMKAMFGETEGRTSHDAYGIRFETDRYILFHGPSYVSSATSNIVITLDNNIRFSSVTFPQSQILFASGSGELATFTAGSNTVTLRNILDNKQKTVTVNRYGVVTGIL